MLILLDNTLKLKQIKSIAKINKIKLERKNKKVLLYEINYLKKIIFIQRNLRKKLMKSNICPITLMPLKYPFISLRTKSGHFCYYQLNEFSMYIIKSKKWENPETREPIPLYKMREISEMNKYYHKKSIIKEPCENHITTTLLGESFIEYINTIMTYSVLTEDNINTIILPSMMTTMFFINARSPPYLLLLVCSAINKLSNHTCPNKIILINSLRKLIALD